MFLQDFLVAMFLQDFLVFELIQFTKIDKKVLILMSHVCTDALRYVVLNVVEERKICNFFSKHA